MSELANFIPKYNPDEGNIIYPSKLKKKSYLKSLICELLIYLTLKYEFHIENPKYVPNGGIINLK